MLDHLTPRLTSWSHGLRQRESLTIVSIPHGSENLSDSENPFRQRESLVQRDVDVQRGVDVQRDVDVERGVIYNVVSMFNVVSMYNVGYRGTTWGNQCGLSNGDEDRDSTFQYSTGCVCLQGLHMKWSLVMVEHLADNR
jgi:hypothetical protein